MRNIATIITGILISNIVLAADIAPQADPKTQAIIQLLNDEKGAVENRAIAALAEVSALQAELNAANATIADLKKAKDTESKPASK